MAEREVLVDSGATDSFICKNLLRRLQIAYLPLEIPLVTLPLTSALT